MFYLFWMIGSRARLRSRIDQSLSFANKKETLSYTVRSYVCVWVKCREWGCWGYPNETPYLEKEQSKPWDGAERQTGGNREAIWLAKQAMHICMLITWQEGGRSAKCPPMRQTERGWRRKDITDTREKQGGPNEQNEGIEGSYRRNG